MDLFSKRKKNKDKGIKKFVHEWLEKLIIPETTDGVKSFRPNKIKTHTHSIEGVTARAKGHQENISAVTGKPILAKDGHQHEYSGAIYADGKQVHRIEGFTSSTAGQGQEHSHKITGRTSADGNHSHKYSMETSSIVLKQEQNKRRVFWKQKPAVNPETTARVLPVKPK